MLYLEGRKQDVDALAFSPDGRSLAVGGSASHLQLWDVEARAARSVLGPKGPHRAAVFLADGHLLTVTNREARVLNLASGVQQRYAGTGANYLHAAPTADGRAVVLCGQYNYGPRLFFLRILPTFGLSWAKGFSKKIPFRLCLCPGGLMAVATDSNTLLIDPETGESVRWLGGHANAVPAVAVSPDGSLLAVAAGTELQTFALADGARGASFRSGGRKHFTDVAFHPSGRWLLVSSNNQTVRIFDASLAEVATFDWEIGPVRRVAFSPDGMRAVAAGKTGRVVVWDFDL